MLEGEPEKVFPEVLCYEERKVESEDGTEQTVKVKIEPMAADIRGKDKSEIKRRSSRKASGFWQRCWGVLMIHCDSGTGNMHFTE